MKSRVPQSTASRARDSAWRVLLALVTGQVHAQDSEDLLKVEPDATEDVLSAWDGMPRDLQKGAYRQYRQSSRGSSCKDHNQGWHAGHSVGPPPHVVTA